MILICRALPTDRSGFPRSQLGPGRHRFPAHMVEKFAAGPTGMPLLLNHNYDSQIGFVTELQVANNWLIAKCRVTSNRRKPNVGDPLSVGVGVITSRLDDRSGEFVVSDGIINELSILTHSGPAFIGARVMSVTGAIVEVPNSAEGELTEAADIKGKGYSEGSFGSRLTRMSTSE